MLRRRFDVFDGIGPKSAGIIRDAGVGEWAAFLECETIPGLSARRKPAVDAQIREWSAALDRSDLPFLASRLPRCEHWSLFGMFAGAVRYLDIETTGLSPGRDIVTVVGISDGLCFTPLIEGQGLTADAVQNTLDGCKLLVTYFGSAFDVPFLRASFPGLRFEMPHFDLCFAGRKVGLTGGLKVVEQTLGLARDGAIAEVDGFEAVRLWRAYRRGRQEALATLLEYNEADTRNLARIAPVIYQRLCEKYGLCE